MVFSSLTFLLLFLPLLLPAYFASRSVRHRNGVLVAASLLFYGWGEPVWILAMLFSTLVNYACALGVVRFTGRTARGLCLAAGVVASLAFLAYFKYAAFFTNSFCTLLDIPYRMAGPRLPIGISFYTFQVLTYTVDVYRGKAPAQKNPLRLLLYVSCFPQLIAGPIVQYSDVADQLGARRTSADAFAAGMQRFVTGLAKKVLLANLCGQAFEQLPLAGGGAPLSVAGAWLGAALYALQIYYDFSAYSDMAIGLGRVFGFTYPENFDYPYVSASIGEFWRRWHISLGAWFRDYLLYPLMRTRAMTRLSRRKFERLPKRFGANLAACLCTMTVWACTGLWHGASWNFVVWGLYYGVLLLLERFVFHRLLARTPAAIRRVCTLLLVLVGYMIFYYTDFSGVVTHVLAMFGMVQSGTGVTAAMWIDTQTVRVLRTYTVYPLLAAFLSTPALKLLGEWAEKQPALRRIVRWAGAAALLAVFGLSVVFLVGQSYNPFIYFRF